MTAAYMQARRARLRAEGEIVKLATEISAFSKMTLEEQARQGHRTLRGQIEHLIFEEAKRHYENTIQP